MQGDDLNWLKSLGVPVEMLAQRAGRTPAAINAELDGREDDPVVTTIEWQP